MSDSQSTNHEESDYPTPEGMQGWLEREIADIHKAAELRIQDAARLVTAYAQGKISSDEVAQKHHEYDQRWGAAIPGVFRSRGVSNDELRTMIDKARSPEHVDKLLNERSAGPTLRKRS